MKKRIVIKLGTGVLATPEGKSLDQAQFTRLTAEIAELQNSGYACIMVSSAAIAAGVRILKLKKRPDDLPGKQACAAAGQPELMRLYTTSFKKHGLNVAQLLLTHGDIDSLMHRENARNTLDRLIEHGVIPIINENDSVAVEELRFGDNDRLSSEVATLIDADRLIILTSTDGLMDHEGRRVPRVRNISEALRFVRPDKGEESTGGMKTKLEAVRKASAAGIACHILDGRIANRMKDALSGENVGTAFGK
ncbi:MAG: glutamate 5-kinase [bacterium]